MRSLGWLAIIAACCAPVTATAQGANYSKTGFTFPTDHKPRVLVMYPEWFIGSLSTKGESETDPAWASAAFDNMQQAMVKGPVAAAVDLTFMTAEQSQTSAVLADARESFRWRVGELIFRVPQGTMPVTKGKKGYYDYTMGPDLAARIRQAQPDAEYALFIVMHDAYSTPGQKLNGFLQAGINGALGGPIKGIPQHHYGNAILVDLRDGAVVWFHGDGAYGGDPRTPDGAVKRMGEAMERFPGTTAPAK